jgi:hypothetical protein
MSSASSIRKSLDGITSIPCQLITSKVIHPSNP